MQHKFNIEAIEFQIASEVRCNDAGEATYTVRAAARLVGLAPSCLSQNFKNPETKLCKYLKSNGIVDIEKLSTTGISESILLLILSYYAFGVGGVTKEKAYESLVLLKPNIYPKKKKMKKVSKKLEQTYQIELMEKLNGMSEIQTIAGNIDILTATQVIEVKAIKDWKAALGQILVYGQFYPSHQKRIHLFGETQESYLEMIRELVKKYDVIVTWER